MTTAFDWGKDEVKKPESKDTALLDDSFLIFKDNKILESWLYTIFNRPTYSADHGSMCYLEGQRDVAREIINRIKRSEKRRKTNA